MPHPLGSDLDNNGYGYMDGFLPEEVARQILKETEDMALTAGEVSKEAGYWQTETKLDRRGDMIAWRDAKEVKNMEGMGVLVNKLEELVQTMRTDGVKRLCQIEGEKQGKVQIERIMVAKYLEENRRFVTHVDNPNKNGRLLTFTYYVSPSMTEKSGGALRVHKTMTGPPLADILPIFNRLACLYSDTMPHEVLPVEEPPRITIVCWFSLQSEDEKLEAMRSIFKLLMAGKKK
eukprot:TRINITY_DN34610_c0_g1_i1.p1 TRINITY_DN34610_c0_g1~~TRINITY_DN34610_c0_g1_i1.p1  ORF type:complete len:250 (+),score=54.28 TRINITY_DN34610_c0_g1_i1:53-751(+)